MFPEISLIETESTKGNDKRGGIRRRMRLQSHQRMDRLVFHRFNLKDQL